MNVIRCHVHVESPEEYEPEMETLPYFYHLAAIFIRFSSIPGMKMCDCVTSVSVSVQVHKRSHESNALYLLPRRTNFHMSPEEQSARSESAKSWRARQA